MGIDVCAICDHRITDSFPEDFPDKLQRAWDQLGAPVRSSVWSANPGGRWAWDLSDGYHRARDEFDHEGWVQISGPDDFSITLHEAAAEICHPCSWGTFLSQPPVQEELLAAMGKIAGVLGGQQLILLPDSGYECSQAVDGVFEGRNVSQILNWLRRVCGPPANSLSSIYRETEDTWEGDGYYIWRPQPRTSE